MLSTVFMCQACILQIKYGKIGEHLFVRYTPNSRSKCNKSNLFTIPLAVCQTGRIRKSICRYFRRLNHGRRSIRYKFIDVDGSAVGDVSAKGRRAFIGHPKVWSHEISAELFALHCVSSGKWEEWEPHTSHIWVGWGIRTAFAFACMLWFTWACVGDYRRSLYAFMDTVFLYSSIMCLVFGFKRYRPIYGVPEFLIDFFHLFHDFMSPMKIHQGFGPFGYSGWEIA